MCPEGLTDVLAVAGVIVDDVSPDGSGGVASVAKSLMQHSAQMLGVSRKKQTASKGGYSRVRQGTLFFSGGLGAGSCHLGGDDCSHRTLCWRLLRMQSPCLGAGTLIGGHL